MAYAALVPHSSQNFAPGLSSRWQFEHFAGTCDAPHSLQNFAPAFNSAPHFTHFTVAAVAAAPSSSWWLEVYAVTAPVSLFLCAVMFSAWLRGFGPSLPAITLSVVAFKSYYAAPLHTLAADVREIPRIFVFALSALLPGC